MKIKILHLQSGDGLSGGISEYIKEITSNNKNSELIFFVNVNNKKLCQKSLNFYPNCQLISSDFKTYNFINFFKKIATLRKLIKKYNIDLVHSHALRAGILCAIYSIFFKIKFIHTNHGLRFKQKETPFKKFIFKILEIILINYSQKYIYIRKIDYESIKELMANKLFNQKNKTKLAYVKTKIKLPLYCSCKNTLNENHIPKIVGIGSLVPVKRIELFIDSLYFLKKSNFKFESIWIGDGILKNELMKKNNEKNIPVKFLGKLSKKDVLKELSDASLFLMTSKYEISPLSLKESLWAGLPIIAPNFYGIREIINESQIFELFPVDIDPFALFQIIKKVLENQKLLSEMSKGSSQYFWEYFYNDGSFNNKYNGIYYETIKKVLEYSKAQLIK